MNDLGEAKAGDGGAINQLARQVGGALGRGDHRHRLRRRLHESRESAAKLSHARRERAAESIEEAQDVIAAAPEGVRGRLTDQVDQAFDVAARAGFGTCVALLLLAAAFAAITLPPGRPG